MDRSTHSAFIPPIAPAPYRSLLRMRIPVLVTSVATALGPADRSSRLSGTKRLDLHPARSCVGCLPIPYDTNNRSTHDTRSTGKRPHPVVKEKRQRLFKYRTECLP